MDQPLENHHSPGRPWRAAALVAVAIAAVELMLLVIVVGALIAKPDSNDGKRAAPAAKVEKEKAPRKAEAKAAETKPRALAKPELSRRQVSVLVLNGNGRQGAAAAAAASVSHRGYKIGGVANAPSHEYARSMIMFRTGFAPEALRLGRDLGINLVGPLDGIRPSQLHGAHAVLILGN